MTDPQMVHPPACPAISASTSALPYPSQDPGSLGLQASPAVDEAMGIWGRQQEGEALRCLRTVPMNICLD